MADPPEAVLRDALTGDRRAVRAFVASMSPLIEARVVRGLLRGQRAGGKGRDIRQEVEDMTQEVFAALFAHGGRVLRSWEPSRGLSLPNFVGLIAERQVASILRSGRRNPWRDVPEELDAMEPELEPVAGAEPQIESRRALERLLDRLREALSPRGLVLFQRLYVEEEPVDEVARTMEMTRDAIYAWRNRVNKVLQRFARDVASDASDGSSPPRTPEEPTDDRG